MTDEPQPQEFRLVAACSIWPPSERRNAAILRASAGPLDWARFLRIALRHRVIGLVHDGLKRAGVTPPEPVARAIADAATAQLRQNLLFAGEVIRLQHAFERHDLPVTFFKGVPTALQIYDDLAIRQAKDIDLLIGPHAILEASAVLEESGYRRIEPPPHVGGARLRTLMSTGKDFVFVHQENSSLEIELHWRLFNNANFLSRLAGAGVLQSFPALNDTRIRTFVGDDQFAYLCAHGAGFAWCRLKWLADIGALLAHESTSITRLYRAAAARGAARPAAQAILLCRWLFGSDVSDELIDELRKDAGVRQLKQLAKTALTQGGAEADPWELPHGLRPIAKSEWLLDPSLRYVWGEFRARWISWEDVVNIPLPRGLQFLYLILRLPIWVGRRLARRALPPG